MQQRGGEKVRAGATRERASRAPLLPEKTGRSMEGEKDIDERRKG